MELIPCIVQWVTHKGWKRVPSNATQSASRTSTRAMAPPSRAGPQRLRPRKQARSATQHATAATRQRTHKTPTPRATSVGAASSTFRPRHLLLYRQLPRSMKRLTWKFIWAMAALPRPDLLQTKGTRVHAPRQPRRNTHSVAWPMGTVVSKIALNVIYETQTVSDTLHMPFS